MRASIVYNMQIRILIVGALIAVGYGVVSYRLYKLQIADSDRYKTAVLEQTSKDLSIAPLRGTIFDRNMTEMAVSKRVSSIYAHPSMIKDPDMAKAIMATFLGKRSKRVEKLLDSKKTFAWLQRRLEDDEAQRFETIVKQLTGKTEFDGLGLRTEVRRIYSGNHLAAPVLGFTNIEMLPKMGIESKMDKWLRGESLKQPGIKNPRGNVAAGSKDLDLDVPQGRHVVLTLDRNFQYFAEKALKETHEQHGADRALAVGLDPRTGDILLMAQYPGFNGNDIREQDVPNLHNFTIEHALEPGSTIKVLNVAAAIEFGLAGPQTIFYCENGAYDVPGTTIHDTSKHGWMTLHDIVVVSSNIGCAKLAETMGAQKLAFAFEAFGFGKPTGIEANGENKGLLNKWTKWQPADLAILGFGQGLSVTPLQLAKAVAAIANGGVIVPPTLIRNVLGPDLKPIEDQSWKQKAKSYRVFSQKTAAIVTNMMVDVMGPEGTGAEIKVPGYTVAGKTGTAQKIDPATGKYSKKHWVSSFVGFLPAENPEIVLVVMIDEPKKGAYYGSEVAGPAFSKIASKIMQLRGIRPNEPKDSEEGAAYAERL